MVVKKNEAPVATTETTKVKFETVEDTFDNLEFEQDENSSGYDEVYFVKMKTKDLAYFEFSKKIGDKIHKDTRTTISTIEGKPTKIELGSYTFENKEVKTLKISLNKVINEKNVLFIISTSFTQSARAIINALLGCKEPLEHVNITVYKNAAGYTSVKMSINKKKSEWKYSIDEQRKHIETIKNKKGEFVSNDYSDLDELFNDELQNHLGILFPEQVTRKIVPEEDLSIKNEEATFGDIDDAEGFFEIENN